MTVRNEDRQADWTPSKLRFELEERGLTYRYLSLQAGLREDSLKSVARTPCKSYERIIANALGMKPEDIWPTRWEIRNRKRQAA